MLDNIEAVLAAVEAQDPGATKLKDDGDSIAIVCSDNTILKMSKDGDKLTVEILMGFYTVDIPLNKVGE